MVYLPAAHLRQDFPSLLHSSQSPTSQSRHLRPVLPEPSLAMGQDATHDCLSTVRYVESPHVTHAPVVGEQATQFVTEGMDGHDLHGEASLAAENMPEEHAPQRAAVAVVPGLKPCPEGHVVTWALHAEASFLSENVLDEHGVHFASSAVAEPGVKPSPVGQVATAVRALHFESVSRNRLPRAPGVDASKQVPHLPLDASHFEHP